MIEIIVSLITLLGVIITSIFSYLTKRHTAAVNDAVNHRHMRTDEDGNVPPKLYDLAIANHKKIDNVEKKVDEVVEWKQQIINGGCIKCDLPR